MLLPLLVRVLTADAVVTAVPVVAAVVALVAVVAAAAVPGGSVTDAADVPTAADDQALAVEVEPTESAFVAGGVARAAVVALHALADPAVVVAATVAVVAIIEAVVESRGSTAGTAASVVVGGCGWRMSSGRTRRSLSPSRYVTKKVPSGLALVMRPG